MQNAFNKSLKRMAALFVFFVALMAAFMVNPTCAFAKFSVYVGYAGGPYYEKVEYSDADMKAMSTPTIYEYSSMDRMPSIRKGFARGVVLSQFFTNAGVNSNQLWRFYFTTEDGYVADDGGEGFNAWYYSELCQTSRYYYPKLFTSSEIENGEIKVDEKEVYEGCVKVPSVLAYESDFHRCFSESDWNSCNLCGGTYRLMFGQTDPFTGNANASANTVEAMTCIFKGTPTITFGETTFEGEVGDVISVEINVDAADPLIEQNAIDNITWEVSDTSVVEFVYDENGNLAKDANGNIQLKVVGEGSASLKASYGNSPFAKYVATATAGVSGSGKGTGDDDDTGKGGGSGGGSGSGSGDGSGSGSGGGSGSGSGKTDGSGGAGGGEGGNSGSGDANVIVVPKVSDTTTNSTSEATEGEAAAGVAVETSGSGGGGVTAGSSEDAEDESTEAEEDSDTPQVDIKVPTKTESLPQAWVVNNKSSTDQQFMVDDPLLIATPAALAVMLFGCLVLGCILRVIACERAKDPYVDKRLGLK